MIHTFASFPLKNYKTMLEFTFRRKIARVIKQLAETLCISFPSAVSLFYSTDTCRKIHNPKFQIHYMSDTYLVNDIIRELQNKQG